MSVNRGQNRLINSRVSIDYVAYKIKAVPQDDTALRVSHISQC